MRREDKLANRKQGYIETMITDAPKSKDWANELGKDYTRALRFSGAYADHWRYLEDLMVIAGEVLIASEILVED